jgi:hypothetical protein
MELDNSASQFPQKARGGHAAGAVAGVDHNPKAGTLDDIRVKESVKAPEMRGNRSSVDSNIPNLAGTYLGESPLVIYVQEFFGLMSVQEESPATDELECVPLCGVVTRRDCDSASSLSFPGSDLDGRNRTNPEIHGLAPRGEETGKDSIAHHFSREARVAADHNGTPSHVGPESAGKCSQELRRQRFSHDATDAGDADL